MKNRKDDDSPGELARGSSSLVGPCASVLTVRGDGLKSSLTRQVPSHGSCREILASSFTRIISSSVSRLTPAGTFSTADYLSAEQVLAGGRGLVALPHSPLPLLPSIQEEPMLPWIHAFIAAKQFSFVMDGFSDEGMIYYPTFFIQPKDIRGLVLMAHGQLTEGYDTPYKYCMKHIGMLLARRGFVSISVKPILEKGTLPSQATGNTILRHLQHVNGIFGNAYHIKGKPIAFIGHSQAGSGVIDAAAFVKQTKFLGYAKVDAVVGWAPSGSGSSTDPRPTSAYLGMRGTNDYDQPTNSPVSVRVYEKLKFVERYFLWMHRCNHRQFLNPPGNPYKLWRDPMDPQDLMTEGAPMISNAAQNIAVAQYTVMFLLWKLQGLTNFRSVFIGEKYVKLVSSDSSTQNHLNWLRVFPRFDRSRPLMLGPLPGAVSFENMTSPNGDVKEYAPLNELDVSCVEQWTPGFVASWDLKKKPPPLMKILCAPDVVTRPIVAVEFHAVLLADPAHQLDQKPVDARVYFWYGKDSNFVSAIVPINIEPPWTYHEQLSVLSTIRIPMKMFDLTKAEQDSITTFVVDFSESSRTTGTVAITGFCVAFS